MPLTERSPSSERQAAAHEIAQGAADPFFLQEIVGKMLEEIVRGRKEHFLCAIPLGVAVDSHYVRTIAQFIWD